MLGTIKVRLTAAQLALAQGVLVRHLLTGDVKEVDGARIVLADYEGAIRFQQSIREIWIDAREQKWGARVRTSMSVQSIVKRVNAAIVRAGKSTMAAGDANRAAALLAKAVL
jgi:hypothetical protein